MQKATLAGILIAVGAAIGLFAIFFVGSSGADSLAWDTVLIGLSAGLAAGGSVLLSAPYVGFIVGPLVGALEALTLFGVPGAH